MSFFLPIAESESATPLTTLPLVFGFSPAATVAQLGGASLGLTFSLNAYEPVSLPLTFSLTASGRIGSEPNVLGAATLPLVFGLSASGQGVVGGGLRAEMGLSFGLSASGLLTEAEEFGFTFYVDILDASLVSAGSLKRYDARLVADGEYDDDGAYVGGGTVVPISAFTLREPSDKLGVALSVTLALADTSLVTSAADVQFDIGVWNGSGWTWVPFLQGGKLAGRDHSIGFAQDRPTDTVQLQLIDLLGDAWARAPRQPVTLYDPQKVEIPAEPSADQFIYTEDGDAITPLNISAPSLTLRDVLEYAYVEGCGFSSVVTNIPDFPVSRADFTIEGGYDAGARALLAPFDPLFFTVDGNVLWIYDLDAAAPAGLSIQELPLSAVVQVQDTAPARELFNSMVVSYQAPDGEYFTERIEQESSESGAFGSPGYTRTEVSRKVREYRNLSEPTKVVRSLTVEITTSVYDGQLELIHREVQKDIYDALQRKTGHTRTVESLVPDTASDGLLLLQVMDDKNQIVYKPHPTRPNVSLQDSSTTVTSGLVLVDNDNTYRDKPFKLPYLDAHRNGFIDGDADQETEYAAIRTVREQLRLKDAGQMDVQVISTDHINNTTERSTVAVRVGEIGINSRRTRVRRSLLTVAGTDSLGRRAAPFDAGELPGDLALELARKRLANLNDPPKLAGVQLPDLGLTLRKGVQFKPHARSGFLGTYVCWGRTIRGVRLGTADARIDTHVESRELK